MMQRNLDQQGRSVDGVVENKQMIDQNEINRQILKQLSQLGERISSMKQGGWTCKKSSDKSKIKNVGKVKRTQKAPPGRLVPQGLGGVSNSIHPTFPTPGQIKNDELIQQQVQERLKQLSENLSQGKEKLNLRGVVQWTYTLIPGSNGHMSLFCPELTKKGSLMTSCPLCSGWLAFAGP